MKNKIIIAGCGLSGMITALSLAHYGLESIIIEKKNTNNDDFFNDVRTTALTSTTKNFFKEINIWSEISTITRNINDIYVVDNKSDDMLHFQSPTFKKEKLNPEPMGHIVENNIFKKTLLNIVLNSKQISLIDNINYILNKNDEIGCSLILGDGRELLADLLIICDGFNSSLKQNYFNNIIQKNYDQCAITFLVNHKNQHDGTAVEHFMPNGPFAILPLKDSNTSSVVWTVKHEMKEMLMACQSDEFTYIIKENFGKFLGDINIISEVKAFPLKACVTKNYYNQNIVVLADSAHIIHPLAGQGLNQGIKDIKSLIINILEHNFNKEMFINYEKDRLIDNIMMFEITDKLNSLFSHNLPISKLLRKFGFKSIERISPLKNLLVNYAMGIR